MIRRILTYSAVAAVMAAVAAGCGTSEENYRKAYEKAQEGKSADGVESTIYNRVRERATTEYAVVDGDTLPMAKEYVTPAADAGYKAADLQRYNVLAGQFKQLFHAKSLRQRIAERGYDRAVIVQTAEPLYYVVALSTASLSDAKALHDSIAANPPVRLSEGYPRILRAANR